MANNVIWKYPLDAVGEQKLDLPEGAQILCVQAQRDVVTLWAATSPDVKKKVTRTFQIFGTGHPMPSNFRAYLGTVQVQNGSLVWHVFELI